MSILLTIKLRGGLVRLGGIEPPFTGYQPVILTVKLQADLLATKSVIHFIWFPSPLGR